MTDNTAPTQNTGIRGLFAELGKEITSGIETITDPNFAKRAFLGTQTPDQIIDLMVKGNESQNLPASMTVKANPQLEKLGEIIKADPALKEAFKQSLIKDKTMLPGLQKMAEGSADPNSPTSPDKLVETLSDPANKQLLTNVLTQIAKNDNDDINFAYFQDVTTLGAKLGGKDAKAEDYQKMMKLLAKAGIADDRLETGEKFAKGDFWGIADDFFKNPDKFTSMLTQKFDLSQIPPEYQGIAQAVIGIFSQVVKGGAMLFDPKGDFLGHYVENVGKPLYEAAKEKGADMTSGHPVNRIETPKARETASADDLVNKSEFNVAGLRMNFNPNATGERLDGYKSDNQNQVAAATFTNQYQNRYNAPGLVPSAA